MNRHSLYYTRSGMGNSNIYRNHRKWQNDMAEDTNGQEDENQILVYAVL